MRQIDKRLVLALVIAAVFLGMFLRGLHWAELGQVLAGTSVAWLLVATVLMLASYAVMTWRWALVVRHLDPGVSMLTLWNGTAVGAAFNTFLPLRGGDLVKPALVASKRGVPFATMLSTTFVERLCDVFGVVGSLLVIVAWMPAEVVGHPDTHAQLQTWGAVAGALAVGGLAVVVLLATRQAKLAVARALRPVPKRIRTRALYTYFQLVRGMEAAGNPLRLIPALFATAVLWALIAGAILASFRALGHPVRFEVGLFVAVVLTVSVSVPQAPGFLGLFQVAMEQAAALWGVPEATAEAGSFVLWFVYVVPITLFGAWAATREGHGFFRWRRELLQEQTQEVDRDEIRHLM